MNANEIVKRTERVEVRQTRHELGLTADQERQMIERMSRRVAAGNVSALRTLAALAAARR